MALEELENGNNYLEASRSSVEHLAGVLARTEHLVVLTGAA